MLGCNDLQRRNLLGWQPCPSVVPSLGLPRVFHLDYYCTREHRPGHLYTQTVLSLARVRTRAFCYPTSLNYARRHRIWERWTPPPIFLPRTETDASHEPLPDTFDHAMVFLHTCICMQLRSAPEQMRMDLDHNNCFCYPGLNATSANSMVTTQ